MSTFRLTVVINRGSGSSCTYAAYCLNRATDVATRASGTTSASSVDASLCHVVLLSLMSPLGVDPLRLLVFPRHCA